MSKFKVAMCPSCSATPAAYSIEHSEPGEIESMILYYESAGYTIRDQSSATVSTCSCLVARVPEDVAYSILIHPAPDVGGYWVECLEKPGVYSQGDTVPETLRMMAEAWELMEDDDE